MARSPEQASTLGGSCFRWIGLIMAVLAAVPLGAAAGAPATCALLSTAGAGPLAHAARELVGTLFNDDPDLALVERADLQQIVDEWSLAQGAITAPGARRELARLLGADMLVFFSEETGEEGTAIAIRVADADTGLQVASEVAGWRPNKHEKTAEILRDAIRRAKELTEQPFLQICAVPPFECLDVSYESAGMAAPLALLAERALLARGRVAVAELSEVDALAQEIVLLRETSLQRVLPHYFIGQYRTRRQGEDRQLSLSLKLRHAASILATNESGWIAEREVNAWMASAIELLLPGDATIPKADDLAAQARAESGLLASRGSVFKSIGEYDSAAAMLKSAVLLDPANIDAHFRLVNLYGTLIRAHVSLAVDAHAINTQPQRVTHYLRPFNDSLAVVLRGKIPIPKVRREMWVNRSDAVLRGYDEYRDPLNIRHAFAREILRQADLYREVLEDPALCPADPRHLNPLFECLSVNLQKARAITPDAVWPRWKWLVHEQYRRKVPLHRFHPRLFELVHYGTEYAALPPDSPAILELALLESELPEWVGFIRGLRDCMSRVTNETTLAEAKLQVRQLNPGYPLSDADLTTIDELMSYRLNHVRPEQKPQIQEGRSVGLTALAAFPPGTRRIDDWSAAGAWGDCVAASDGLWRVESDGNWKRLSPRSFSSIAWDGEALWGLDAQGIHLLQSDGRELLSVSADRFPAISVSDVFLAAYAPGKLCVLGELTGSNAQRRMWASRVTADGTVDMVYEERVADRAAGIKFVQPVTWMPQTNGPRIWVGFNATARVLSLDPEGRNHAYLQRTLPFCQFVLPDQDRLLVMEGWGPLLRPWNGYRIYSVTGGDATAEIAVDLSPWIHPPMLRDFYIYPYAGALVNGYVHLLMIPRGRPEWTVVDLKRSEARLGRLFMPEKLGGQLLRLVVSPHYGLIALSQDTAYQVEVPPFETLAPMPVYKPDENPEE